MAYLLPLGRGDRCYLQTHIGTLMSSVRSTYFGWHALSQTKDPTILATARRALNHVYSGLQTCTLSSKTKQQEALLLTTSRRRSLQLSWWPTGLEGCAQSKWNPPPHRTQWPLPLAKLRRHRNPSRKADRNRKRSFNSSPPPPPPTILKATRVSESTTRAESPKPDHHQYHYESFS